MRNLTKSLLTVGAGILLVGGLTVGATVKAPEARAVLLNGLCTTDGYAHCARQTGSYFDWWNRDISGDTNQQMSRSYQGQVSSSGCWPFNCGSGLNAALNNTAVYKIFDINTGQCMLSNHVLGDFKVTVGNCSSNGSNWVWDGSEGNAALVNVYMSNHDCPTPSHCVAMDLDVTSLNNALVTYDSDQRPIANSWGLFSVLF
jgi:hypothetical protein